MMHTKRKWCVIEIESAEKLAAILTEEIFGCCNAFCVRGYPQYVWANDSTSSDRLQEYGVLKRNPNPLDAHDKIMQVESITTSWCNTSEMLRFINRTLAGEDDRNVFALEVDPILQTPQEHGRCCHCA